MPKVTTDYPAGDEASSPSPPAAFAITRRIEIDAGHRIADHHSKCRGLHGHRYRIEATVASSELKTEGGERGMVMDFGFLKEEMVAVIDKFCDHALILAADDPGLPTVLPRGALRAPRLPILTVQEGMRRQGYWSSCSYDSTDLVQKLYVIGEPPTAENLAKHWFGRLAGRVSARSRGVATLSGIVVWETPNCAARFPHSPQ